MNNHYAYVTALTSLSYIPGVIGLKKSLIKVKSKYSLIVLIPEGNFESFMKIINMNKIADKYCKFISKPDLHIRNEKSHYWDLTFFKLRATTLIEYDKIILIDSDMLVNKNIDHLFECDSYSAVVAGKATHEEYKNLNSGLIVLKPSIELFNGLLECVNSSIKKRANQNLFAGDQDVFIEYKSGWVNDYGLHLSEKYNCFYNDIYRVAKKLNIKAKNIDVIHFIGKEKPWMKKDCFRYYLWLIRKGRLTQYRLFSKYKRLCKCKYE